MTRLVALPALTPAEPPVPLRWQILTAELETRARWSEHCARLVQGQATPVAESLPSGSPDTPARFRSAAVDPSCTPP